jgi:hypothetical protein
VIPRAENVDAKSSFRSRLPTSPRGDETWYSALSLSRSDGSELVFVDPSFAVASPSRYFDITSLNAVARSIDLCYIGISAGGLLIDDPARAAEIVLQARGPECEAIAPNGPATLRVNRIAYDDPRSIFTAAASRDARRHPRHERRRLDHHVLQRPLTGERAHRHLHWRVKQFVSAVNNSTASDIDRVAFGADSDPARQATFTRRTGRHECTHVRRADMHVHSLRMVSAVLRAAPPEAQQRTSPQAIHTLRLSCPPRRTGREGWSASSLPLGERVRVDAVLLNIGGAPGRSEAQPIRPSARSACRCERTCDAQRASRT